MKFSSAVVAMLAAAALFAVVPAVVAQSTVTVVGRELHYGGRRVVLHGVGMADPLLARQNRPASDYAVLAGDWKATAVRLAIHPGTWKSTSHDFIVSQLRKEVNAALANGMFVIITWHVIGWPNGYFQNSAADPNFYDSNFQLAKDYWTRIATEFGADGRIIFELWNEPVHQNDVNGMETPRWMEMKPFFEQLIAIVRQRSGNLVLATGNDFASDLRGITAAPLADANAAYTWHVYAFGAINEAALSARLAGVDGVRPVLVTEWGFNFSDPAQWPGDAVNFGPAFVTNFLRARQLHSTAWAWAPGWNPTMLEADFATPTSYGAFVKGFFLGNRAVTVKVRGKKTRATGKSSLVLKGNAAAALGLDRIEIKVGQARYKPARGVAKWTFKARGLKDGRTKVRVRALDIGGTASADAKLSIIRQ